MNNLIELAKSQKWKVRKKSPLFNGDLDHPDEHELAY